MKRLIPFGLALILALAWWAIQGGSRSVDPIEGGAGRGYEVEESIRSPSNPQSTNRQSAAVSAEAPGAVENSKGCVLRLLELSTGMTPVERVRIGGTRVDGREQTWDLSADQPRADIPGGQWTFEVQDSELTLLEQDHLVTPGTECVLWLASASRIQVLVANSDGLPLPGAQVRWHSSSSLGSSPWRGSLQFLSRGDPIRAESNEHGHVELTLDRGPWGRLEVSKPGYLTRVMRLAGSPESGLFEVRLSAAPNLQGVIPVQVVDALTHAAVERASLRDEFGVVPGGSRKPGSVELPTWLPPHTEVAVDAEGYCTSMYTAEELADSPVVRLWPAHRALLSVSTDEEASEPPNAVVHVRVTGWPGESRDRVVVAQRVEVCPGEAGVIDLPRGARADLWAYDDAMRTSWGKVLAEGEESSVHLNLRRQGLLRFQVRDASSGVLLPSTVRVDFSSWRFPALSIRARDGRFELPYSEFLRKVHIHSPGFVSQTLYPPPLGAIGSETAYPVEVLLKPAHAQRVRVVGLESQALAGVRVSFSPDPSFSPEASAVSAGDAADRSWKRSALASCSVLTDGDGIAVAPLAIPVRYTVRVMIPLARAGDRSRSMLYRPQARTLITGLGQHAVDLVFPAPILARIQVESLAENPVGAFTIECHNGNQVLQVAAGDGEWSGWLPESIRGLTVSASGFETTVVSWSPFEPNVTVQLRSSKSLGISMRGPNPGWVGALLRLKIRLGAANGADLVADVVELTPDDEGRFVGTLRLDGARGGILYVNEAMGDSGEWRPLAIGPVDWVAGEQLELAWP